MPDRVGADVFLNLDSTVTFDVRSPSEHEHGNISGSINLPLFDDQQRAQIGTIYAEDGHDAAVLAGLDIVGPKMGEMVREANRISSQPTEGPSPESDNQRRLKVYCWRGGMRSQSMAWLMEQAGYQVTLLDGGYKAYRQLVRQQFEQPLPLTILSGLTGAGKTKYLQMLQDAGEQVIDLEGLANHRGSAFGGVGLGDQPSTEAFENQLFDRLRQMDLKRRIWVEDEGNRIGAIHVPDAFYQQMRHAAGVFIDMPMSRRIDHLVDVYGGLELTGLESSVRKIQKRLGPQNTQSALAALAAGDLHKTTQIVLAYYDKTYLKAVDLMPRKIMPSVPGNQLCDQQIVAQLITTANNLHSLHHKKPPERLKI